MKKAILRGPKDLRIETLESPNMNLNPDDLYIKTEISAFKIGTDRGNYEGAEVVPGANHYPRGVGDSNLGRIEKIGSNVKNFKIGDRVVTRAEHQSEYIYNQNASIVKVPENVDSEDAVFCHLYTLSAQCYRKANFTPGENVAIIGVGVLGLGAIALGPLFGARTIAIANSEIRLEMAKKMGAHAGFLSDDKDLNLKLEEFTNKQGVDLVILTANPWPAYKTSVDIVRPGGRVSIVSLLGRGEKKLDFNPLELDTFYGKGIHLVAVNGESAYLYPHGRTERHEDKGDRFSWNNLCDYVLALMSDGNLEPKKLITHRLDYTDISEAYDMAFERNKNMLGVIFKWNT